MYYALRDNNTSKYYSKTYNELVDGYKLTKGDWFKSKSDAQDYIRSLPMYISLFLVPEEFSTDSVPILGVVVPKEEEKTIVMGSAIGFVESKASKRIRGDK